MVSAIIKTSKVLAVVSVLAILLVGNASASVSWNVAKRTDEKIIALNKQLMTKLEEYPHLKSEPIFIFMSDQSFVAEPNHYNHILNRLYFINDASEVDIGSRRFIVHEKADIKEIGAWRLRDGQIERMEKSAWEIIESDDLKEIYFAPKSLEDGDIIGFSMDVRYPWRWGGGYLWLADDMPSMLNRTRVKSDDELAYRISWYHFRKDHWSNKILSRAHGNPNDVRVALVDVPAIPDGSWTPTEAEFMPYIYVSFRGEWWGNLGTWVYNVSWNEVAAQEMIRCNFIAKKGKKISFFVNSRIAGLETESEKLDALHRFVRDEVVSVHYREVADEDRDIVTAVENRQATSAEKGMMLYTMCRSAGIEVELLAGRSRFSGEIDRADPTGMQLVDYVVKLNSDPPRYYTPQFDNAPAGVLPPQMQGRTVMVVPTSLPTTPNAIILDLLNDKGGSPAMVWNQYREIIKAKDWAKWVKLPGDPLVVTGTSRETVRVDPVSGESTVKLQVTGQSRLQYALRAEKPTQEILEDYLGDRFTEVEISGAKIESGEARNDTLMATAALSGLELPQAGADEWIIPAAVVYGRPVLSEWDPHDGDPFIVRATERQIVVWRVPLPDGWNGIQAVGEFKELHPRISYMRMMFQEEGDLVVVRTLQLNQGLTMYSDLPAFRKSLDRIQAHEQNPILVMRK